MDRGKARRRPNRRRRPKTGSGWMPFFGLLFIVILAALGFFIWGMPSNDLGASDSRDAAKGSSKEKVLSRATSKTDRGSKRSKKLYLTRLDTREAGVMALKTSGTDEFDQLVTKTASARFNRYLSENPNGYKSFSKEKMARLRKNTLEVVRSEILLFGTIAETAYRAEASKAMMDNVMDQWEDFIDSGRHKKVLINPIQRPKVIALQFLREMGKYSGPIATDDVNVNHLLNEKE